MANWKEFLATLLVVLGAAGAAWKWGFAEWLRIRSEIPALDGELKVRVVPLSEQYVGAEILTIWRNRGTIPVFVNVDKTRVEIFDLPVKPHPDMQFTSWVDKEPSRCIYPLTDAGFYFLEPSTDSQINTIIVLPADRTFLVTFRLSAHLQPWSRWQLRRSLSRAAERRIPVQTVAWVRAHLFTTRLPSTDADPDGAADRAT